MSARAGARRMHVTACVISASALALVLVARAPRVHAQSTTQVDVSCAGDDVDVTSLEAVLRELLVGTRIEFTHRREGNVDAVLLRHVGAPRSAAVRVWIDLRGPTHAVVVLVDERAERVVLRQVPFVSSQHADEVVREEVAHIVSTSACAILAGVAVGVSREDARRELALVTVASADPAATRTDPAPLPVEQAAAARPTSVIPVGARPARETSARSRRTSRPIAPSLRVALGYEARLWSSDELTHGAALSVDAGAVFGRFRVGARLEIVPRLRVRRAIESLAVVLDPLGARLLATFSWRATQRITLDGAAGAMLEVGHIRAIRTALTPPNVVLAAPRTRVDVLGNIAVGASLMLGARVALGARVGVDIAAAPPRYVWLRDGEPVVVYAPAPFRPALQLYVSGELL